MAKQAGKKLFNIDKIKSLAQGDDDYYDGYDDMDITSDTRDYSGGASRSVKLIFMKEEEEFRQITEYLKKGSVCMVNLTSLPKEIAKITLYRIEGILDAIRGSKECAGEGIYILLPSAFAIRVINQENKIESAEVIVNMNK